ncbi:MAG TPA: hypothetical protein VM123_03130 [archaeon]|nr:hypothetical protein [archaeon]
MIFQRSKPSLGRSTKKRGFFSFLLALLISIFLFSGCAGGSLLHPRPLIGKDRLVFRIDDTGQGATYYTRNLWFDGDNYRFRDSYGIERLIARSDDIKVNLISTYEYYEIK